MAQDQYESTQITLQAGERVDVTFSKGEHHLNGVIANDTGAPLAFGGDCAVIIPKIIEKDGENVYIFENLQMK